MTIRNLSVDDIARLREIHLKFYAHEFEFPDFAHQYACSFLVEDESQIVVAAGVRTILELVAITNKDISAVKRVKAFGLIKSASEFTATKLGYDSIHAFIQDESWQEQLIRVGGFKPTKGNALILGV